MRRALLVLTSCIALLAGAIAGTPKESDFPDEVTVVESGSYPNHVCWLVLRLEEHLYRVRDVACVHTACLTAGTQARGQVKGPTKAVPQKSWFGRMGSDTYVKVLYHDDQGKPKVASYRVEGVTQAAGQ